MGAYDAGVPSATSRPTLPSEKSDASTEGLIAAHVLFAGVTPTTTVEEILAHGTRAELAGLNCAIKANAPSDRCLTVSCDRSSRTITCEEYLPRAVAPFERLAGRRPIEVFHRPGFRCLEWKSEWELLAVCCMQVALPSGPIAMLGAYKCLRGPGSPAWDAPLDGDVIYY